MSRWLYMFRFFLVVPPMPLLMIGAFAVITVAIAAVVVLNPSRATGALTPILLLQLFACSSGFDVPARRGHYDLLLMLAGESFLRQPDFAQHGDRRGRECPSRRAFLRRVKDNVGMRVDPIHSDDRAANGDLLRHVELSDDGMVS